MFSVLISGVKFLLIGLRNALMDSYIFSILYKHSHFFLLFLQYTEWADNTPNILCPRYKKQKESQLYFILYCKLSGLELF